LVVALQNEQADYYAALKKNSIEPLQAFLIKHPNGAYSEQARQKLIQLRDKEAVLGVLRRYEEAYNKRDLDGMFALWPTCPEPYRKTYRDSFRSPQPPKLKLELDDPDIQGIMASVKGTETRSGALNSSSKFTAKLMKQGDKWVIQGGIF
jgi:hypothetical protein